MLWLTPSVMAISSAVFPVAKSVRASSSLVSSGRIVLVGGMLVHPSAAVCNCSPGLSPIPCALTMGGRARGMQTCRLTPSANHPCG